MKIPVLTQFVILITLQFTVANRRSYEGFKTYHVTPKTKLEADIVHALGNNPKYDFWMEPRALNTPASLMVAPDEQANFEKLMKRNNINFQVLIENVESTIPKVRKSARVPFGGVSFDEYLNHTEINAYLNQLALNYPNIATLEDLGTSYEGRDLLALKISSGGVNKPTIFIDAAIHAREWIAPSVALYVIHQLVENASNWELYKDIDWIILPVLNPDGYDFSRTLDAMWRKTRTPTSNASCYGTDANRNFDHYWNTIGASSNPCSTTYAGPQPSSELETQALQNYLQTHKGNIKLYLTFHSYGRYLLYPWGYTQLPPSNNAELYNLGFAVADALKSLYNTSYTIGPSSTTLYSTSGSSQDYAAGEAGIQLSYTVELPEGGSSGFHPPVERIRPIVTETFLGVKAYWEYIQEKYVT